ncbi:MAG TPA: hypothetical protein VHG93_09505 [Longimicrobium sp.]|nr:hypothetical protein [Longimicrobium sp.]
MARGPNGETNDGRELTPAEWEVLRALEGEIDAALRDYQPTQGRFVYDLPDGVRLTPTMRALLARWYREAGWARAVVGTDVTGSQFIRLDPAG